MGEIIKKNFDSPDESREPTDNVKVALVDLGSVKIAKMTAQPGWKWSEHIKPIVGTEKCENSHTGVLISGSMMVVDENENKVEVNAGDAYYIGPLHDGWVIGNDPITAYEFDQTTAVNYGKK